MALSVSSPLISPPLPHQLLTTSGYTCSVEFRFQTECCLALVFCRISLRSGRMLSLGGPVVREGEALTACVNLDTFQTSPAPASSPPHGLFLLTLFLTAVMHTPLSEREQIKE